MENQVKSKNGSKIAYIACAIAFGLFVASLGALVYKNHYSTLYGKDILFKENYTTAQGIMQVAPGRLMFSECIAEDTELKITEDTVIFKTKKGSIGFKPLSTQNLSKLDCIRKDGTAVVIERIKTPKKSKYTTDEVIIIIQPEATIMLTKEAECIPLGKN